MATLNTYLLPNLVTSLPLKGIVINCPTGNASKILPSPASLKCNDVLISGILLAQFAKDNPWQKKKTDTAIRTCSLFIGDIIVEPMVKFKYYGKNNLIQTSL